MRASTRHGLAAAAVASSALAFALVLNGHEPIAGWLFVRYFRAALCSAVFSLACLVAGHAVLVRALRRTLPLGEHLAIALPLGVLAFYLSSFAFGMLGLYGGICFVLCPSLLVALGARDALRTAARLRRHASGLDGNLRLDWLRGAVLAFGVLGILYLWFTILSPQNASYDARWYHLTLAELHVTQGKIGRFEDGWVFGAYPELASLLYAWAFSAPGTLFDRVVTAAHLELAMFLMTLIGVSAVVRRVLGERAPLAWAGLFLFPGISCYDSGLVLGADHVAALFAPPIFLLSLRYFEAGDRSVAPLLGAVLGGAVATKYSAVILWPFPLALILARAVGDARRPHATRVWTPVWFVVASLAAVTAPHWLKNWVFYGDPLFPLLRRFLPVESWSVAAEGPYETWFHPHRPPFGAASMLDMVRTLCTFSFVPHDFAVFHRDVPVFGSLFTLTTPLLIFVRRRRLALLYSAAYLGIVAWFWIHQFDRYLQVLVPWMAAGTAIVLIELWRERGLLRPALGILVGVQVIWGAAVPFFPTHRAAAAGIVSVVNELLGRGFRGESKEPPTAYPDWEVIARALPRGAKVLVHEERLRLGLGTCSVLDFPGDQGVFYWGESGASTPGDVWRKLRAHSVTHVLYARAFDHGFDTVAGGLVFFEFAIRHTEPVGSFGVFELRKLRAVGPPDTPPGEVAYETCESAPSKTDPAPDWNPSWAPSRLNESVFRAGLYALEDLARAPGDPRPVRPPMSGVSEEQALERAHFLVLDGQCHPALAEPAKREFEPLATRGAAMLYVRR